jgi:hypothetical protein
MQVWKPLRNFIISSIQQFGTFYYVADKMSSLGTVGGRTVVPCPHTLLRNENTAVIIVRTMHQKFNTQIP